MPDQTDLPPIPNLYVTRPSIADTGRPPSSPEHLYDPGLSSPFNTPPLGQDNTGVFGYNSPPLQQQYGMQTPPARRPRGRRYPSQDGYITSPYTSPQISQGGFDVDTPRSRSRSPSGSPSRGHSPIQPGGYLERLGSSPGSSYMNRKASMIDPLDAEQTGAPIAGTAYAGATARPGAGQDMWHRHQHQRQLSGSSQEHGRTQSLNSPTRDKDDREEDDDDDGKKKKVSPKSLVWSTLTTVFSSLNPLATPTDAKGKREVIDADLRRKSTGTASATVRARKQKERARRGLTRGWVNKKNLTRAAGVVAVVWVGRKVLSGSSAGEESPGAGRKPQRNMNYQDLFHPQIGIYRNLPRHVLDEPAYHSVSDGLLQVNTSAPVDRHPVYQLIKEARDEWEAKKKRQSRTLKGAVQEYRRRYGLEPPKGFDKWWEFVVLNDVQLPDEYDQIDKDLNLYRALSPDDLNRRLDEASEAEDTFTISIKHHNVRTRSTYDGELIGGADDRLEAQIELLMDYGMENWLDDMRVVYGIHDGPTGFIGYDLRSDLETLVLDREYYREGEELDTTIRGWEAACPYGSPARRVTPTNRASWGGEQGKTFVQNPTVSQIDVCNHPEFMDLHGALNGRRPHVQQTLLPTFSLSKTSLHTDVLGVPMEQWMEDLPTIDWEARRQDKLLWRGSNTGAWYSDEIGWRRTHRVRLVELAGGGDEIVEVIPPPLWGKHDDDQEMDDQEDEEDDDAMASKGRKKTIGEGMRALTRGVVQGKMLDIAFAGEPLQCETSDGTCDQLAEEYLWSRKMMTHEEALEYKYVVDVDGNTWSSRFQRLLLGNSVVFKSTIMPEWWNQRAQPWVHFVPVGLDYGDLVDALVFFRGGVDGKGGEDELARQIADEGRQWTLTHWRKVDMAAYIGRVYLEWARLVAPSRSAMDFVYDESMEVELHYDDE